MFACLALLGVARGTRAMKQLDARSSARSLRSGSLHLLYLHCYRESWGRQSLCGALSRKLTPSTSRDCAAPVLAPATLLGTCNAPWHLQRSLTPARLLDLLSPEPPCDFETWLLNPSPHRTRLLRWTCVASVYSPCRVLAARSTLSLYREREREAVSDFEGLNSQVKDREN